MDLESFSSITQPAHLTNPMDREFPKWEDVFEHLTQAVGKDVLSSNEFATSIPEQRRAEDDIMQ